jgi:general stress protein 26
MAKTTNERDLLWELIEDIKFAMFTTRHSNGHLHSRPLTTQNSELDEHSSLWFFVSRRSDTVADIAAQPQVNVVYADPSDDSYVSVSGEAAVVEDPAKKEALWTKATEAWFPGGVTDPDLALLEVRITHANYWDVKDSKLVQLLKIAKAAVTGKPPTNLGEHGEVRMK